MNNPIQTFDKIKENLILYIKTAFNTRYPNFEKQRKDLLNKDKILVRAPWVEPLPKYKGSGYKITDQKSDNSDTNVKEIANIPNLNEDELRVFKDIVSKGLIGDYELHYHQYEMLTKAMEGNHCVITSGTGSGKTESFLLPLFAYLSKELNQWKNTKNEVNNTKWWGKGWGPKGIAVEGVNTLSEKALQRPNINRPAAVRAMLIYPMNALVEDQLSRLRKALDSDKVRSILKNDYNDNRIYFGRYNSSSPISGGLLNKDGEIGKNKIDRLKKELVIIENEADNLNNYISENPDKLDEEKIIDLKSNFQQLDGAEMRTRFDMQETPPDIMITNFSMISIMLMREIEDPIFDKTKAWLECSTEFDKHLTEAEKEEERKNRVFHLIVDELHMYRGGSGSETAYIIRMLLSRLGLTPDSDQLRILASSASLEGTEGGIFLKSFFGTEDKNIEIIKGKEEKPEISDYSLTPLSDFAHKFSFIGEKSSNKEKDVNFDKIKNELSNLLVENDGKQIVEALYSAFIIDKRVRAVPAFKNGASDDTHGVKFISEVLFGEEHKENKNAVKGFFYLLGLLDKESQKKYPSMRFHLFYRNIAGMWGELISDNEIKEKKKPVGRILTTPEISCNNHRTLELLYCENCGTIAFGGSRVQYKTEDNDRLTELMPVSPDIEGVPETSTATIVEKRKYNEFSVFFPGNYDYENIIEPEFRVNKTDYKFSLNKSWVNINSGRITTIDPNDEDNYLSGCWAQIKDDNGRDIVEYDYGIAKRVDALPPVCPHCESDYSHPLKARKSPFRGFRTGFGKISQILSKELFEELPEGENSKKLVAFTDSREDAAVLSKNIEEEHYQALLKEIIIHNVTNELQFENDVLLALENNDENQIEELEKSDSSKFNELGLLFENYNSKYADSAIKVRYNSIKDNIKPISDFVKIVIKKMLDIGINPAGPYKSLENFVSGKKYIPWHNFYDFETCEFDYTIDGVQGVEKESIEKIEESITSLIFGRLYFSFEASGLGYPTVLKNEFLKDRAIELEITTDKLYEICNSFIRILGNAYRHNRNNEYKATIYDQYNSLPKNRKARKYVKKVSEVIFKDEIDVGNIIFRVLQNNKHRGIIEINNLKVKISKRDDPFYKCERCGTIHLHKSGGICIFCLSPLASEIEGIVENLWSKNYLTHNLIDGNKPFKLHTEELTGQTDDQLLRQRQFKNIFTDPIEAKIERIDLLSVTTTLEVGVDIGSLQAIFLANMPPQRFNYQQRVGRTGRRGQLYSYSLTFARGRTHDEYYFDNPFSITGDEPPQPFLSLDQKRIFKRILAKAILRMGFKALNNNSTGSVHGEFGNIEEYDQNKLQDVLINKSKEIEFIFDSLNKGIYSNGELKNFSFKTFADWINNLPKTISSIIKSQNAKDGDLAELLAESGILPMAGMPTRIKNLIHGIKSGEDYYEVLSVDRDLEMAIYEFAPGAQKTKDKGVIQSIGFTPNIINFNKDYSEGKPKYYPIYSHNDAFTSRKWLIQNSITKIIKSEDFNINTVDDDRRIIEEINPDCDVFVGATPSAFRTDYNFPKDSSEDFDFVSTKPLTFAETTDEAKIDFIGNSKIRYYQQEYTWKINKNGGKQFVGKYITQKNKGVEFENQWIDSSFINEARLGNNFSQIGEEETISLAARKVTEVFRVEPKELDLCLDINPFDSSDPFKSSSSKGAFYSAAFLLQRTLANNLDIDPEEIEIAAIDSIDLPALEGNIMRRSASIVLTDELPNGSGFIQQLFLKYNKYINKCINPKEEKDLFNYSIISNLDCFDASYSDLKNYRNMHFHPLLDWRLSVGLLRVFNDSTYLSGLKEEDYNHPEMIGWLNFAEKLAKNMEQDFDNIKFKQFGKLFGFCFSEIFNVIIVHPFWNYTTHQPSEEPNYLTDAIEAAGIDNTYFVDTFNLHRRHGWCYSELIKKFARGQ
ncbi:MAG: DEAD/DEAH box helicase [Bacilli bacterium]|nr:DEAD/DEAH box helicase [Bacilli bacterium]